MRENRKRTHNNKSAATGTPLVCFAETVNFCLALEELRSLLIFFHSAPRISYYDFIEIQSSKTAKPRTRKKLFRTSETIDNLHKTRLFHSLFLPFHNKNDSIYGLLMFSFPSLPAQAQVCLPSSAKVDKRIVNYERSRKRTMDGKNNWKCRIVVVGSFEKLWVHG
jgi:hypothetical protein